MSTVCGSLEVNDSFRCPSCKGLTRTAANPFFGTGLSVHRYTVQCVECEWTDLVRDVDEDHIPSLR